MLLIAAAVAGVLSMWLTTTFKKSSIQINSHLTGKVVIILFFIFCGVSATNCICIISYKLLIQLCGMSPLSGLCESTVLSNVTNWRMVLRCGTFVLRTFFKTHHIEGVVQLK